MTGVQTCALPILPKELLDICAELGIPREKVNIVLRMTEEGSDEKAGV